jgi:hypothetical protein
MGRPHETENKVRLALGTVPAWQLNDTSVKALCHRADLDATGCSAARLSYLFRLGKCIPLSPPKPRAQTARPVVRKRLGYEVRSSSSACPRSCVAEAMSRESSFVRWGFFTEKMPFSSQRLSVVRLGFD